jgi:hypothetical protein
MGELMQAVLTAEPQRASLVPGQAAQNARKLRGDLEKVLAKAVSKEPGRRYASVEQLADDLKAYRRTLAQEVVVRETTKLRVHERKQRRGVLLPEIIEEIAPGVIDRHWRPALAYNMSWPRRAGAGPRGHELKSKAFSHSQGDDEGVSMGHAHERRCHGFHVSQPYVGKFGVDRRIRFDRRVTWLRSNSCDIARRVAERVGHRRFRHRRRGRWTAGGRTLDARRPW